MHKKESGPLGGGQVDTGPVITQVGTGVSRLGPLSTQTSADGEGARITRDKMFKV